MHFALQMIGNCSLGLSRSCTLISRLRNVSAGRLRVLVFTIQENVLKSPISDASGLCACKRVARNCVNRSRIWKTKRDDRSGVSVGAG